MNPSVNQVVSTHVESLNPSANL